MGRANFNSLSTNIQVAAASRSLSRNIKPHPHFHTLPTIPWRSATHFMVTRFRIAAHHHSHPFSNFSASTISSLLSCYRSYEATNDLVSPTSHPSSTPSAPKMPAFNKAKYIASLPIASATRLFSEKSDFAGQPVHPRLEDLSKPPTRNEHIIATLAHSRGEVGIGCNRVALGRRCEFAETIVLMTLWKGKRLLVKCTNCHFASDNKAQCGAVPAHPSQALLVSLVGVHLMYFMVGNKFTGQRAGRGTQREHGYNRRASVCRSAWTYAPESSQTSTPEQRVQSYSRSHSGKHRGALSIFAEFLRGPF